MAIRGGDETGDWLDFYVPLGALDHAGLEYWDGRSFFRSSVTDDWLAAIGTEVLVERAVAEFGEHAGPDSPRWARVGGVRQAVFSRSLGLVMAALFLLSWLAQSIAGVAAYNEQQLRQLQAPIGWTQYVASADFWSRSLQNWQSELLAVASMAILSVYLRQRGSPESKPVGTPHTSTGVEG
ncbi:hypothetical protein OV320_1364 [Actinobacteria bacterium OV320]|nr:hypothetical protein OV320_1364 [Actinobacteria bacterium OV320]